MSDQLARELAEQVVTQGLLLNWVFYAVLIALSLVCTAASTFAATYIRKRSETYATKVDLADLVAQLKATTEAAENVRTAIAHADWSAKEWKTLRRLKLEELLEAAHSAQHWLDKESDIRLYGNKTDVGPSPLERITRISALYFPELSEETAAFKRAWRNQRMLILDLQSQFLSVGNDMDKRVELHKAWLPGFKAGYGALLDATGAIELKAPSILKEIVDV
jgi:hypothetical protein